MDASKFPIIGWTPVRYDIEAMLIDERRIACRSVRYFFLIVFNHVFLQKNSYETRIIVIFCDKSRKTVTLSPCLTFLAETEKIVTDQEELLHSGAIREKLLRSVRIEY